ncbi:Uncharacterised protein [Mycobacteroides abscessus subsp. abscessus]|nr:Uncharacterised protein [Mycobacteroides abscessus subsp. abscessus]
MSTTRRSSSASSSVSSSQDTSTYSSAPRLSLGPGPSRSQPLRTAGAVTRAWCRMEPGMFCSSGEGSRSLSIGVTPITSPSRTSGVNAPQWVWESRAEPLT